MSNRNRFDKEDSVFDKWRPNSKWFELYQLKDSESKEEKEKLTQRILAASDLFDVVRAYAESEIEEIEKSEGSSDDFNDSSWSHKQACRIGEKNGIRKIIKFLPPKTHGS